MAKSGRNTLLTEERIIDKIYLIRGKKVMLDFDLSEMYKVETKQLKRQVKRNKERFPFDFMFELTEKEYQNLRSQIGTSSWGGSRYFPMAFTEQGVAMLSSVLNSRTAIRVNIQIIRVFSKMKEMLLAHKDILHKLEQLEQQVLYNSADIKVIFSAIKKLFASANEPKPRIGFRRSNEE